MLKVACEAPSAFFVSLGWPCMGLLRAQMTGTAELSEIRICGAGVRF